MVPSVEVNREELDDSEHGINTPEGIETFVLLHVQHKVKRKKLRSCRSYKSQKISISVSSKPFLQKFIENETLQLQAEAFKSTQSMCKSWQISMGSPRPNHFESDIQPFPHCHASQFGKVKRKNNICIPTSSLTWEKQLYSTSTMMLAVLPNEHTCC